MFVGVSCISTSRRIQPPSGPSNNRRRIPRRHRPRWLHRDRDSVYSETFRRRVAGMGVAEVVSAPASPWQNPYVERVIGSIRRECLDHVVVLNQVHLRRILTIYSWYDHRTRTHLGLAKDAPEPRLVPATSTG